MSHWDKTMWDNRKGFGVGTCVIHGDFEMVAPDSPSSCPACDEEAGEEDCPKCGGDEEAEALVCEMCEGEGIYEYNVERETGVGGASEAGECEDCRGQGYIECPDCHLTD